jgi:hypothetical protein
VEEERVSRIKRTLPSLDVCVVPGGPPEFKVARCRDHYGFCWIDLEVTALKTHVSLDLDQAQALALQLKSAVDLARGAV